VTDGCCDDAWLLGLPEALSEDAKACDGGDDGEEGEGKDERGGGEVVVVVALCVVCLVCGQKVREGGDISPPARRHDGIIAHNSSS